jgi:hypothetical protein
MTHCSVSSCSCAAATSAIVALVRLLGFVPRFEGTAPAAETCWPRMRL